MKKALSILMLSSLSLFAVQYSVNQGWTLLGTNESINVSTLLENSNIKNITIYQNGYYLHSANNEFTTIPENSGFWVYAENATTMTDDSSQQNASNFTFKLATLEQCESGGGYWDYNSEQCTSDYLTAQKICTNPTASQTRELVVSCGGLSSESNYDKDGYTECLLSKIEGVEGRMNFWTSTKRNSNTFSYCYDWFNASISVTFATEYKNVICVN